MGINRKITMDISYIKSAIEEIFSKSGYKIGDFVLRCPNILSTVIKKDDAGITIDFKDKLPSVKTKKLFLPITAQVEGIFFGTNGGSIKLKYFPDFHFKYDFSESSSFGSNEPNKYFDSTMLSINKKYPDAERRKIAEQALQYANEWVTIASKSGTNFSTCSKSSETKLRKDCQDFVYDNIIKSKEIKARSAVLGFILLYFVIPAVVSWVVKKLLDNFFK